MKVTFLLFLACISTLHAQTAPAPAPATEPLVTLSPFEVNTSRDAGFVAASSLAGGRLEVDTTPGVGSSFRVIFPAAPEEPAETALPRHLAASGAPTDGRSDGPADARRSYLDIDRVVAAAVASGRCQ